MLFPYFLRNQTKATKSKIKLKTSSTNQNTSQHSPKFSCVLFGKTQEKRKRKRKKKKRKTEIEIEKWRRSANRERRRKKRPWSDQRERGAQIWGEKKWLLEKVKRMMVAGRDEIRGWTLIFEIIYFLISVILKIWIFRRINL